MPDGMSGIDLGEIGQAVKQQGQKVAGQVAGQITKQVTGSSSSTPAGQTPKTTTGIDLVDFGKSVTNQFGVKPQANPKPPATSAGFGNQLFGKPKPGTGGVDKGFGNIFGGELGKKNLFGGMGGANQPSQPEDQMPDFSREEAEKEQKLKEARKRLFDEVYGNEVLDIGKTDQNKKKQEEDQKRQEEEERKRQEEEEKAQQEQGGLGDFGANAKPKKGMIGQPRNKKGGFNFLQWLKPKRQSNESNSGNRG